MGTLADAFRFRPRFSERHLGPNREERQRMLVSMGLTGADALGDLIRQAVPRALLTSRPLDLPPARTEREMLEELREMASRNHVLRSMIGCGYSDCITPPVIQRNVLENPGWYTAYTPYQPEVSQGRLEALLNFQTMVSDLTGLEVANASLLDEATAASEAMAMAFSVTGKDPSRAFFVSSRCHPQTIAVVQTRAEPRGIQVVVEDPSHFDFGRALFGALLPYPDTEGAVEDYRGIARRLKEQGALTIAAVDLLSLLLLEPPGAWGADVAVGSAQRFGVPLGYGGPHAAFFATQGAYARAVPGRIIGVSQDAQGRTALRMALQTREQHIRREKATSNVCTAQALLANIAGFYAVYHGPHGLRAIADRVHAQAAALAKAIEALGFSLRHAAFFDTLTVEVGEGWVGELCGLAARSGYNLRAIDRSAVGIALDETTGPEDLSAVLSALQALLELMGKPNGLPIAKGAEGFLDGLESPIPEALRRTSSVLEHPVFNRYHSETEMLRYLRWLESRDLSLTHAMIPLGSCTMKLNATSEMAPLSWPEWSGLHPFAPTEQTAGYRELFHRLERALAELTGFSAVSLQPNAGSQGELAGLLAIRGYHRARGEGHRNVCLIPSSAHGTNPASAVMAGYQVVVTACDAEGNVDPQALQAAIDTHRDRLAALMITYPSTHGVFEEHVRDLCAWVHRAGGQVYLDGANMNALVGLCRPAELGADVCHLNLHKTFCIPHGGGGPGMGPIAVATHLAPHLPSHPFGGPESTTGPVSAAPFGSASILPISYAYIAMMGGEGLTEATRVAILNANYVARRLEGHYPVLYRGKHGRIAHECLIDLRPLKRSAGIEVDDVAKRLIDYGFHAPTVSFPVAGTMMIEPTESESLTELDRFCEAMIAIRNEIHEIEEGRVSREDNPLKNAPHTSQMIASESWSHPYSRELAAFPTAHTRRAKFWPAVGRLNHALGDRQLFCSCPPVEEMSSAAPERG